MQQLENYFNNHPQRIFFLVLLLAFPAFFTNLGLLPLFADEPTRANVALEMILSGNFSVPTIGGEYYYNKPPLYNWMLAGLYSLTGSSSEFVTRLPAVIPMFLYAITIYYAADYFLKDKRIAALSGLAFIINSRMLLYDSMLGHIDIFYSLLTFSSFMLIFYFYQQQKWFLLFFVSYLITAITFLSKGLPSIAFQGFTLIALLSYTGNFKKFFSWQHILSGFFCLAIIGAYFYNYHQYNPNLETYFSTIWDQSSRRTANAELTIWKRITYLLFFPFEHLIHIFPVSLLALFALHKGFVRDIKQNPFLKFITIIFLANIWVYCLSPLTRPRYLLMLYPLVFIVSSYAYYTYRDQFPRLNKIVNFSILILAMLITLAVPVALLAGIDDFVERVPIKVVVLFTLCLSATLIIWRSKTQKFLAFAGLLIFLRLGFSWFIIPHRLHLGENKYYREIAIEMGNISKGMPFYFYQFHPPVLAIPFHDRLIFYIQSTRMQGVKFVENVTKPGYYFTFDRNINMPGVELVKEYKGNLKLYEVK